MNWIDDVVAGLLDLYGTCDPFDLCDYLDITLRKVSSDSCVLMGQHSIYFRSFFGSESIMYSSGLRYKRLKFYILHELGHAILHPDVPCSNLMNTLKMEREANYFAVKLIFATTPEINDGDTYSDFALLYDIPKEVFRNELREVGSHGIV